MEPPEWPEYLDALEAYLEKVTELLGSQSIAAVPTLSASQPEGPVPLDQERRAAVLLAKTQLMEVSVADWVEGALSSKRSVSARRPVEPGRGSGHCESLL